MVFICMMTFEKTGRGEDLFAIIATIIAVLNMLIGYKDHMKLLPYKAWGD